MAWGQNEGQRVQHGWAELKCERGERPSAHFQPQVLAETPGLGTSFAFNTPLFDTVPRTKAYE